MTAPARSAGEGSRTLSFQLSSARSHKDGRVEWLGMDPMSLSRGASGVARDLDCMFVPSATAAPSNCLLGSVAHNYVVRG